MNRLKYGVPIIKLLLFLLVFTGCVTRASPPTLPATQVIATAFVSTTTSTATTAATVTAPAPIPTSSMLQPGGKVGQMTLEIPPSHGKSIWDDCTPAWPEKPGVKSIPCLMPYTPEFEIGYGMTAKDNTQLEAGWNAVTWEQFVDNQAIDLNSFGTYDADNSTQGGTGKSRYWNVRLTDATSGVHILRYVLHVKQEFDSNWGTMQPGTYEMLLNLIVAPVEQPPTETPIQPPTLSQVSWWNQTVFYEAFVRSFADSATGLLANDGIGDLQGLIAKLDYLNDGNPATTTDLGVTGLWLMPIMQSPSYHGYDITDYYAVNKDYGTNDDFKRLLSEAHKRGIKVLIDLVLNHTSSQHPWFIEARDQPTSAKRDWYIWSVTDPGYPGPYGEQVWFPSPSGYYYGIFSSDMPDLNYTNPQVTAEMDKVARYWLEDIGVDGFRLDAARYLIEDGKNQASTPATHEWWKNFRTVYKTSNPEAVTVGEVASGNVEVVTYLKGDELDMAFDFNKAATTISGVMTGDANKIQSALTASYGLFGSTLSATFLTNHDMNRTMSQLSGDVTKAKLAATVLLTEPGVPFIYYGEEIGMTGIKPDENIRTPMQWSAQANAGFTMGTPWEAVNADYPSINVATESKDPASLLSCYRDLVRIHADHPALQIGDYRAIDSGNDAVLAYLRTSQEDNVLVVMNLGEKPVSSYTLILSNGNLIGNYKASLLYGGKASLPGLTANTTGGFDSYQPLTEIPAGGVLIIQLQPAK